MSSSRVSALVVLLVAALFAALAPARADVFALGDYRFTPGEEPGQYELVVSLPEAVASTRAVTWPAGCTPIDHGRATQGGRARLSFVVQCDRDLTRGDTITTPWAVDGAAFTTSVLGEQRSSPLQPTDAGVVLPIGLGDTLARPFATVAAEYVTQGVFHILGGWDHLAFVLCLCLLTRGRTLLLLVTVFTLGHSLSLALAFLEIVTVPVPPVEAVIALSIAFMAREALRATDPGGENAATRMRYIVVVAAFGLLHGLGFATVLDELGVARDERVAGLVFFNVGVELGQLAFVAGVLGLVAIARRVGREPAFRVAALYGAGVIGCFWLFERVAGFAGASV